MALTRVGVPNEALARGGAGETPGGARCAPPRGRSASLLPNGDVLVVVEGAVAVLPPLAVPTAEHAHARLKGMPAQGGAPACRDALQVLFRRVGAQSLRG